MLAQISHTKKMMHQVTDYLEVRLVFTVTAFNVLIQWDGLQPKANGFIPLPITEFSL